MEKINQHLENKGNLDNNQNFNLEGFPIYKEIQEISVKVSQIESDLRIITNHINTKENMNYEFTKEEDINEYDKENIGYDIFVDNKEMNNLFNDFYFGLYNINMKQNEFQNKFNILKNRLISEIEKNNNNFDDKGGHNNISYAI